MYNSLKLKGVKPLQGVRALEAEKYFTWHADVVACAYWHMFDLLADGFLRPLDELKRQHAHLCAILGEDNLQAIQKHAHAYFLKCLKAWSRREKQQQKNNNKKGGAKCN